MDEVGETWSVEKKSYYCWLIHFSYLCSGLFLHYSFLVLVFFFYHSAQHGRFGLAWFGLVNWFFISFLVCKENGIKAANMEFFFGYCIHKKGGLIWIYNGTGKRVGSLD